MGGGGGGSLVTQYWGPKSFFLTTCVTLYNFENIGGASTPPPLPPRSLIVRIIKKDELKIGYITRDTATLIFASLCHQDI